MKRKGLSPRAVEDLEHALGGGKRLSSELRQNLERHLNAYRELREWKRITPAQVKRWRAEDDERIDTARRLLSLLDTSQEDLREARTRGTERSALGDLLAERLAQWEARPVATRRAVRPKDWDRRVLLWRCMEALDTAGIPPSCHRDGPRISVLREVLRLADRLDGRSVTDGSLRLIQSVYRDRRDRHTWRPRAVLRYRYERPIGWPHS